jgi:hypothetical protein
LFGPANSAMLDPGLVSPVVGWLASDRCSVTGEIFSAGAGRVARVFIAEGPGFSKPDLTIEDVDDHVDEIRSEAGYVVPSDATSELVLVAPFLDLSNPQGASA